VVNSPGLNDPVQIPAPLTIRKKSSQGGRLPPLDTISPELDRAGRPIKNRTSGLELRQQYYAETKPNPSLERIEEDDKSANGSNSGTIVKKKSTWFKRSSKSGDENEWKMSIGGGHAIPSHSTTNVTTQPPDEPPLPFLQKKKGFSLGRLFKRRPSNPDMTLAGKYILISVVTANANHYIGNDTFEESDDDSDDDFPYHSHNRKRSKQEDLASRQIEPQRSWIAKLFNVKPAMSFICFAVSKRKARAEIVRVLKDWKRYGIRGVQVDKDRSIVFGRVAAKNCMLTYLT
jgi:hypothetical protein